MEIKDKFYRSMPKISVHPLVIDLTNHFPPVAFLNFTAVIKLK